MVSRDGLQPQLFCDSVKYHKAVIELNLNKYCKVRHNKTKHAIITLTANNFGLYTNSHIMWGYIFFYFIQTILY